MPEHRPYKWLTQSWLVDAYLHCGEAKINRGGPSMPSDVVCPNATARAAVEADILYEVVVRRFRSYSV